MCHMFFTCESHIEDGPIRIEKARNTQNRDHMEEQNFSKKKKNE